jgi:AcrR family transcriptional regulator
MGVTMMDDLDTRERILKHAVNIFSVKGFHGTSMRDIAKASACSLPTLYYYYHSKSQLFEEIVVHQFMIITENMNRKLNLHQSPEELYLHVLKTRMELQGFDREVYKMALKVWLGFEGEGQARDQILEWERKRADANKVFIDRAVRNENLREDVTEIFINYMENIINRIILLDETFEDEKLKRQIALLFQIGTS